MKTVLIGSLEAATPPPDYQSCHMLCPANTTGMYHFATSYVPQTENCLAGRVGPLIDKTDLKIMSYDAANVTIFPKCPTRPLSDWIAELQADGDMKFHFQRPQFVSDVGYALMTARKAAGYKRKAFAKATGLARATIYEMESGDRIGGSPLGKVAAYLSGCNASLIFTLTPHNGGPVVYQPFSAKMDTGAFCGQFVKNLRTAAGLTQAELNHHLRLPAAMERPEFDQSEFEASRGNAAPQISAIERLADPDAKPGNRRTLRLGTLFTIAYFCGYTLSVMQDKVR